VSGNIVEYIKKIYKYIKFRVKCGHEVADFCWKRAAVQDKAVLLNPYLFNMFTDDVIDAPAV
jgi:hypothetical protein